MTQRRSPSVKLISCFLDGAGRPPATARRLTTRIFYSFEALSRMRLLQPAKHQNSKFGELLIGIGAGRENARNLPELKS